MEVEKVLIKNRSSEETQNITSEFASQNLTA